MLEAPNKPESKKLSFYPQVRHTSETLPQSQNINDGVTINNSFSVAPIISAIPAGTCTSG